MFGLVPRLFQDLRYSMRRALLVYFHSRVWHTICYSPKMVYFTAQECEENEGECVMFSNTLTSFFRQFLAYLKYFYEFCITKVLMTV